MRVAAMEGIAMERAPLAVLLQAKASQANTNQASASRTHTSHAHTICHHERTSVREGAAFLKRSFAALAALLLLCLLFAAGSFAQTGATPASTVAPVPWNKIQPPPLPPFNPPQPKRIQLANGMVIFLQEDHELPLISATARIRGGSIYEPAAKVGMAELYGEVWRTGGTKTKTGDEMDDFLEARAAKLETGAQADSTSVSLNCLKGDLDPVFAMFLDLLQNPEFREDKLELAKRGLYAGIARRNDDVNAIASREAMKIAYGKDNPYARTPEFATVAAVTRQDLLDWHARYVHPNNIVFGIAGDFDSGTMESRLQAAFGSWSKGPDAVEPKIEFAGSKPRTYFVQKSDVNQSTIDMLGLGIRRDNPDYYPITVMNEIFGGGFSSRLFNNIRAALGLAYSVGGGVGASYSHPGLTSISMQTKSSTTVEGIKALETEIDKLHQNAATPEELVRAKSNILNSFIFHFDTPEKVLREKMTYEFYHYPLDFLERYRAGIDQVTADDVTRVARKYVQKEKLGTLIVGNESEFDKPLSALGPVEKLDISIAPPPASLMGGGPEQ